MTAEEFLKNRKNIHDKTISDGDRIMDFWEIAEIMQEYADHKQLSIPLVGNHVFCPHCGDKRQLKVETDLNSGRVCKSRLCKGK